MPVDRTPAGQYGIVLLFCPDSATLVELLGQAKASHTLSGAVWVCWPKKAAKVDTDIDEFVVRRTGLDAGMVDVKVCAVDEVWSGLKFVRRLADRT